MVDSLCQIFISILDYGNEHKVYELLSDLYDLVLKPQLFFELGVRACLMLEKNELAPGLQNVLLGCELHLPELHKRYRVARS